MASALTALPLAVDRHASFTVSLASSRSPNAADPSRTGMGEGKDGSPARTWDRQHGRNAVCVDDGPTARDRAQTILSSERARGSESASASRPESGRTPVLGVEKRTPRVL